jgi:hypothetical protein
MNRTFVSLKTGMIRIILEDKIISINPNDPTDNFICNFVQQREEIIKNYVREVKLISDSRWIEII